MKAKIEIEISEDHDLEYELTALANRYKYKRFFDDLYDEVFRPVIKYSDDESEIDAFDDVWDKVREFRSKFDE
jgi:hypothetical protein